MTWFEWENLITGLQTPQGAHAPGGVRQVNDHTHGFLHWEQLWR
jgi:hypothetical protein